MLESSAVERSILSPPEIAVGTGWPLRYTPMGFGSLANGSPRKSSTAHFRLSEPLVIFVVVS